MQYNPYQNRIEVARVNGKQGAEMYYLPPNSSILLLDEGAPIVWLKSTNELGYASLTPYDIVPHIEKQEPTLSDVLQRLEKLEGMLNESNDATVTKSDTADEPDNANV